jgi:protein gp37
MARNTAIEWTEHTWNPVVGCTKISEGCAHCYAEAMTRRFWQKWGCEPPPEHFRVKLHTERLLEPLHWCKPARVFVCSMGDLFHPDVPNEFIDKVWAVMAYCSLHQFQVLTKRPARMLDYLTKWEYRPANWMIASDQLGLHISAGQIDSSILGVAAKLIDQREWPALPNVWLGVTAENQTRADERIPLLLQTPAAVRFVSCEPLLGPVEFSNVTHRADCVQALGKPAMKGLDWVIVGPETGPGARPMHPDWARSLRQQCAAADVAFFYKRGTLDGVTYHEYPEATK